MEPIGQNLPWLSCSTIGPSETAGKNVRPPMMTMTPMVRPMNMALSVRNVPRDAGTTFLAASAPPRARAGMMMPNRPISMAMAPQML